MKYEKFESLSNLIYPAVGLLAFIMYGHLSFTLGMITLGVGSFWFHKHKEAHVFDVFGMAIAMTVTAGTIAASGLMWTVLLIFLILYSFLLMEKLGSKPEIAIFAVITFATAFICNGVPSTIIALGFFGSAFGIKQIDKVKKNKFSDSITHSVWHILTGIGFYLLVAG